MTDPYGKFGQLGFWILVALSAEGRLENVIMGMKDLERHCRDCGHPLDLHGILSGCQADTGDCQCKEGIVSNYEYLLDQHKNDNQDVESTGKLAVKLYEAATKGNNEGINYAEFVMKDGGRVIVLGDDAEHQIGGEEFID